MLNFEKITKAMDLEGFTRVKHISWATFHANMVTISMNSESPPAIWPIHVFSAIFEVIFTYREVKVALLVNEC